MPQAINITIKDGQSTPADCLFTLLTPAAGNSPAVWSAKTKGPTSASQPRVELSGEGFRGGRKLRLTVKVPAYVTGTDGKVSLIDNFHFSGQVTIPDTVPVAFRADAVAYIGNLLSHALIKETLTDGYAPA